MASRTSPNIVGRQSGGRYIKHIDLEVKVCNACNQEKPATTEFFSPHKGSLNSKCKLCSAQASKLYRESLDPETYKLMKRRYQLKKYDLTIEEYEELVEAQDGLCAICLQTPGPWAGRKYTLVIDHNHQNGKTRGLLCNTCNRVLGLFGDDIGRFLNAVNYLLSHEGVMQ